MKEDIIANESEWVKYLPKSFKIANHTFKVVQYNEFEIGMDIRGISNE